MGLTVFAGSYIAFCFIIAYLGREVFIGFWGVLILSVFFTPLLTAILILIFRPKPKKSKLEDLGY